MSFRDALESGFIFMDGSMGTVLQTYRASGGTNWKIPEELNLTNPELIQKIHRGYLDAGATVILTNTFGANRYKLAELGYTVDEVIQAAVSIAKKAVSSYKGRYIALNVSSTGKLLSPMGELPFDEAYEVFAEMAIAGEKNGVDLVVVETMSDLYEMKAAVLAVKEHTSLPVIASATFQENNRMLNGADPATVVTVMEGLGVDAVGFNCGGDLTAAQFLAHEFLAHASIPVFMEPNAGIPVVENGTTVFKIPPEEFADTMEEAARTGVRILGGCCGTVKEHIAAMVKRCSPLTPLALNPKQTTCISSWSDTICIGDDPVIVGERINPTGKKRFKEALLAGDQEYILSEAQSQIDSGAHILDVNVGLPGIDEASVMDQTVSALQRTFRTPLQIDSSESAVLDRALRHYNGKALVNSVNGKKSVMDSVFPLIKKYGGVVVALTLDEDGIPPTAEGRLDIAKKIIKRAGDFGIDKKNIIVDTLTLTVSSQQKEALETVKALSLVRKELGVRTILGVSNISFGLPLRDQVNSIFLTACLSAGLSACIINPLSQSMMGAYHTWRALAGYDENCLSYIDRFTGAQAVSVESRPHALSDTDKKKNEASASPSDDSDLFSIILCGLRDRSQKSAHLLLETKSPVEIIDGYIVPALDRVGKDFETGKKYLPQLLLSAETVSRAFEVIREHLARSGVVQESKGCIVMATVHGDIHDIGKNIVKAMLENYGYTVIDLGKDVPADTVLSATAQHKAQLVGLSALMTTTVANMEKTIGALRASGYNGAIMAGGAVLTEDYAKRIGADYYAKDAMASVAIAKKVFGA
ncbi:MAG: homocysteine S-methyltransferase family protein [Spirochaetales bacterium]|nr:homocysteine S-methyltransferase family protein [Spirochaetales bacterium]